VCMPVCVVTVASSSPALSYAFPGGLVMR
jgi:hypothetical protein